MSINTFGHLFRVTTWVQITVADRLEPGLDLGPRAPFRGEVITCIDRQHRGFGAGLTGQKQRGGKKCSSHDTSFQLRKFG